MYKIIMISLVIALSFSGCVFTSSKSFTTSPFGTPQVNSTIFFSSGNGDISASMSARDMNVSFLGIKEK